MCTIIAFTVVKKTTTIINWPPTLSTVNMCHNVSSCENTATILSQPPMVSTVFSRTSVLRPVSNHPQSSTVLLILNPVEEHSDHQQYPLYHFTQCKHYMYGLHQVYGHIHCLLCFVQWKNDDKPESASSSIHCLYMVPP